MTDARRRLRRMLGRVPGLLALARLVVSTVRICMRYRVTGLASEAGFFALLSLPPLILGLVGGLAYVANAIGPVRVDAVLDAVNSYASQFLTPEVIKDTLLPTIEDVASGPRFDLLSLGFVLSLWSGSRALNVFVDTISIMYGQSGVRGIVRTRALSFSLYLLALALGIVTIPLVLLGPSLLGEILPEGWDWLIMLYWPLVTLLTVGGLTSLYHISTPRRSPWLRDAPGAVVTMVLWIVASFVVRGTIAASLDGGHLDLRPALRPDRAVDLALHAGHRGAHRGRRQRVHPRAVPARGAARPARTVRRVARGAAGAPHRAARAPGRLGRPVRRLRTRGRR